MRTLKESRNIGTFYSQKNKGNMGVTETPDLYNSFKRFQCLHNTFPRS